MVKIIKTRKKRSRVRFETHKKNQRMRMVHKSYKAEAKLIRTEDLAEHLQDMDEFFKKNPSVKKKWDKFIVNKYSKVKVK